MHLCRLCKLRHARTPFGTECTRTQPQRLLELPLQPKANRLVYIICDA